MGRHKTLSDQDILRRARPVFLNRGLDARTRDVAAAVGMTWAAIALRFGSKRGLFEQAMEHRSEWFEEPPPDRTHRRRRARRSPCQSSNNSIVFNYKNSSERAKVAQFDPKTMETT